MLRATPIAAMISSASTAAPPHPRKRAREGTAGPARGRLEASESTPNRWPISGPAGRLEPEAAPTEAPPVRKQVC